MQSKLGHLVDDFISATNLREATVVCHNIADEDDLVIYSPSCLAEDEYRNFVERGAAFTSFINDLEKEV